MEYINKSAALDLLDKALVRSFESGGGHEASGLVTAKCQIAAMPVAHRTSDTKEIATRERLVKLLHEADKICDNSKHCEGCVGYKKGMGCVNHLAADYLTQNGVIAPPAFVGQMVYCFCPELGGVFPYFVETIHIGFMDKEKNYWTFEANCHDEETDELLDEIDFDLDDIGKTVFLTREAAEAALEARNAKP